MDDRITINTQEYLNQERKLAKYEAALRQISTIGVGAYLTIDGWSELTKIAQRTALSALQNR